MSSNDIALEISKQRKARDFKLETELLDLAISNDDLRKQASSVVKNPRVVRNSTLTEWRSAFATVELSPQGQYMANIVQLLSELESRALDKISGVNESFQTLASALGDFAEVMNNVPYTVAETARLAILGLKVVLRSPTKFADALEDAVSKLKPLLTLTLFPKQKPSAPKAPPPPPPKQNLGASQARKPQTASAGPAQPQVRITKSKATGQTFQAEDEFGTFGSTSDGTLYSTGSAPYDRFTEKAKAKVAERGARMGSTPAETAHIQHMLDVELRARPIIAQMEDQQQQADERAHQASIARFAQKAHQEASESMGQLTLQAQHGIDPVETLEENDDDAMVPDPGKKKPINPTQLEIEENEQEAPEESQQPGNLSESSDDWDDDDQGGAGPSGAQTGLFDNSQTETQQTEQENHTVLEYLADNARPVNNPMSLEDIEFRDQLNRGIQRFGELPEYDQSNPIRDDDELSSIITGPFDNLGTTTPSGFRTRPVNPEQTEYQTPGEAPENEEQTGNDEEEVESDVFVDASQDAGTPEPTPPVLNPIPIPGTLPSQEPGQASGRLPLATAISSSRRPNIRGIYRSSPLSAATVGADEQETEEESVEPENPEQPAQIQPQAEDQVQTQAEIPKETQPQLQPQAEVQPKAFNPNVSWIRPNYDDEMSDWNPYPVSGPNDDTMIPEHLLDPNQVHTNNDGEIINLFAQDPYVLSAVDPNQTMIDPIFQILAQAYNAYQTTVQQYNQLVDYYTSHIEKINQAKLDAIKTTVQYQQEQITELKAQLEQHLKSLQKMEPPKPEEPPEIKPPTPAKGATPRSPLAFETPAPLANLPKLTFQEQTASSSDASTSMTPSSTAPVSTRRKKLKTPQYDEEEFSLDDDNATIALPTPSFAQPGPTKRNLSSTLNQSLTSALTTPTEKKRIRSDTEESVVPSTEPPGTVVPERTIPQTPSIKADITAVPSTLKPSRQMEEAVVPDTPVPSTLKQKRNTNTVPETPSSVSAPAKQARGDRTATPAPKTQLKREATPEPAIPTPAQKEPESNDPSFSIRQADGKRLKFDPSQPTPKPELEETEQPERAPPTSKQLFPTTEEPEMEPLEEPEEEEKAETWRDFREQITRQHRREGFQHIANIHFTSATWEFGPQGSKVYGNVRDFDNGMIAGYRKSTQVFGFPATVGLVQMLSTPLSELKRLKEAPEDWTRNDEKMYEYMCQEVKLKNVKQQKEIERLMKAREQTDAKLNVQGAGVLTTVPDAKGYFGTGWINRALLKEDPPILEVREGGPQGEVLVKQRINRCLKNLLINASLNSLHLEECSKDDRIAYREILKLCNVIPKSALRKAVYSKPLNVEEDQVSEKDLFDRLFILKQEREYGNTSKKIETEMKFLINKMNERGAITNDDLNFMAEQGIPLSVVGVKAVSSALLIKNLNQLLNPRRQPKMRMMIADELFRRGELTFDQVMNAVQK